MQMAGKFKTTTQTKNWEIKKMPRISIHIKVPFAVYFRGFHNLELINHI
jgi:hypothetical protein